MRSLKLKTICHVPSRSAVAVSWEATGPSVSGILKGANQRYATYQHPKPKP
jgi:hypothetical protein